jgi:two-component system, NarL family, captular synthesis response regulator RcsB
MHKKTKLILADDHPALLAGIKYELGTNSTLEVVGTASNSTEIVELLSHVQCDVLITDYSMPGGQFGDGIALLSFLRRRFPQVGIIVFTMLDNPGITKELSKLGIKAVLSKTDDLRHLAGAVNAVMNGAAYFSPTTLSAEGRTHVGAGRGETSRAQGLTKREAEVVRLYVSGRSVKEIAVQLHRSKQTVSAQKMSAMRKFGLERDADLFRLAFEIGLMLSEESAQEGAALGELVPAEAGTGEPGSSAAAPTCEDAPGAQQSE